jgi:diguanylate cyclase (GGDEF)-like protein
MKKLQLFICENFYSEYQYALTKEDIKDVEIHIFPSLCDDRSRKLEAQEVLSHGMDNQSVLICNKTCAAINLLQDESQIQKITGNYCFSHLTCDEFLDYLISQRSYVMSLDWLMDWRKHIEVMGFDQKSARIFFKDTSNQLVFFDSGIEEKSHKILKELSNYLDLPYLIVPIELKGLRMMLRSVVFEWRLHQQKEQNETALNELRNQCAEYSAVFDMMGKISSYTSRREVIGKIKDLFLFIFGAQDFKFWSEESEKLPKEIEILKVKKEDFYLFLKEENRFCLKIEWDGIHYGIIDAKGFMFPRYIEKYLNLAIEIAKFSGLVLHNNQQYEIIKASEKELMHLSFHDTMTGLHNRTYINRLLSENVKDCKTIVFMFDIDRLKYVNDHYGHAEGDQLINSFAMILAKSFRETDIVARIGGDEFAAVLYDADAQTAEIIKHRIIEEIKVNNENLEKKFLALSVSIGYAIPQSEKDSIEELMQKADALMYEDKMSKRTKESRI